MSRRFRMPNAKNNVGCCPSHRRMTDCTSVSDANFCPLSIFFHQTCIVGFVKHLSQYTRVNFICMKLFSREKGIIARCSLQDNFNGNDTKFNVYKWRRYHNKVYRPVVTRIKFPTKRIFRFFMFGKLGKRLENDQVWELPDLCRGLLNCVNILWLLLYFFILCVSYQDHFPLSWNLLTLPWIFAIHPPQYIRVVFSSHSNCSVLREMAMEIFWKC